LYQNLTSQYNILLLSAGIGQVTFNNFIHMRLQVIEDSKGKATGVFIPINEWKELKKQHSDLAFLEYEEPSKQQLLQELKEAVIELQLIEKGKLKSRPAKALLNEL
jgi:hypothetical protein